MHDRVLITGAAGFIGSHLTDRLLDRGCLVTGLDNLVRGRKENLTAALTNPRFDFHEVDLADLESYRRVVEGREFDTVWHLAANSDIGAGVADATVDFRNTFLTTFHTLQLMRDFGIGRIVFASTSAIYGS